jgi:oxalate decarboxylase/phosphoglucose isomerase-like protein (cupin superfamily)
MAAIKPETLPTHTFDWGLIKWFVSPSTTRGAGLTFGEVVLLPGEGHTRHNHPKAEEILYVLSGSGRQMVDDQPDFEIGAGETIYIPTAIYHSTINTGWEPLRLLALYNPGGAEVDLTALPDFAEVSAGSLPRLKRDSR